MEPVKAENFERAPHEIEQEALEARIEEMDARNQVLKSLSEIERRRLWRTLGHKSLIEFCRRDLAYDPSTVREILVQLGFVLPATHLISDDPATQARIDALQVWRRKKSSFHALPAFRILTNQTLLRIAQNYPRTLESLAVIKGIGPRKLEDFGREILRILESAHFSRSDRPS